MKSIAIMLSALLGTSLAVAGESNDPANAKKALDAAKISCHDAIATAQKEVNGGKPVEVELDWDNNAAHYEVELLSGDAEKEVWVCAVTGKVLKVESEVKPDGKEEKREVAQARKALDGSKQSFDQAKAAAAKGAPDAKIVGMELTMVADRPTYKICALQGEKIVKMHVDGIDGKLTHK